jgi:hypothetical protein
LLTGLPYPPSAADSLHRMTLTRGTRSTPQRAQLIGLLLAPLPALSIGVLVMSGAGLGASIWLLNVAAALTGGLAVLGAWVWRRMGIPSTHPHRWVLPLGLALLGATLLASGVEGVHRWLPLGPLQLHVGAVSLPPILVLLARVRWATSVAVAVLALLILLVQPDAAQAASFAAGWIVLVAALRGRMVTAGIITVAALAAATLLRADPLGPVPHVEGIVGLAAAQGLLWASAAVVSIVIVPLALALTRRRPELALAAYMGSTLLASWLGDYPVPILGFGVSPILGYYLALAFLSGGHEGA